MGQMVGSKVLLLRNASYGVSDSGSTLDEVEISLVASYTIVGNDSIVAVP